ncbi:DMT family transporter [Oecophyllibacter saccharovorans]|uniref:DMT family transporter n=1 Tax=Oecophyllibacter saccharovorans TaxID=2558360 RepID=UPI0011439C78|nr:multidrug efflux SMR transporter [Oecophyllibacter saccharovorans]QDH15078.1 multidrug efflux SMR transporter [Oecophyllibacter saccharovorans]TPW35257.1 multidrug efflux SMR transporter [Oecophyllibacter saccharovorans]
MPSLTAWLFLLVAILLEVAATSLLNASDGFRRAGPALGALALYAGAFFSLARALRVLPLGLAYAVWCGVGIVCIALIGAFIYRQHLSPGAWAGIGLIFLGTLVASLSGAVRE